MKPLPFRLRLAGWSALISGGVLLGFGITAWHFICRERVAGLDREILALAWRHPGWLGGRPSPDRLGAALESLSSQDRPERVLLLITTTARETRYQSPHWPADLDPATLDLALEDDPRAVPPAALSPLGPEDPDPVPSAPRGPPWLGGGRSGRGGGPGPGPGRLRPANPLASPFSKIPRFTSLNTPDTLWRVGIFGHGTERLVLGLNQTELQADLDRLGRVFLGALPLALLAVGLGGWVVAGRALRPLRSIAHTAERVTARGLDQRIPIPPAAGAPEIARLIAVLNGMMDRLEASFHQATRFSADASHELRTPLAVMQAELEQALQTAPASSPVQRTFAELLEQTHRLKAIIRGLLWLAQADAGQLPINREAVPLSTALQHLLEEFQEVAQAAEIEIAWQIEPDLMVQADGALLQQAVLNLLRNALTYNEPRGRIGVRLEARNDRVEVAVWNTGPGIPPADQPRVFDRFFRVDPARSRQVEGVGLGLSLAREVARIHEGTLTLEESRPGHTCFRLSLPRLP